MIINEALESMGYVGKGGGERKNMNFRGESRHKKTCFLHMRTTKTLISAFVIRCLDSIMPLVSVYEISSLWLASVTEQAGLSLEWSQTPKTGFLVTRLGYMDTNVPKLWGYMSKYFGFKGYFSKYFRDSYFQSPI